MARQSAHPSGHTRSQYSFAQVPHVAIPRSQFNRSCGLKTAFDAGYLVPIFIDEALPGDTLHLRMAAFGRIATLLFPIIDNIFLDFFFFAVPNRLIWDNWQKFCGEQTDPGDSIAFSVPQMTETVVEETLSDYMGIPIGNSLTFNSLHHRAYNLIWNEWFRDENLQDSVVVDTDNGPDTFSDYVLLRRGKRHDYLTSCLPWTQKGTAVSLPLGTEAPVIPDGTEIPKFLTGPAQATSTQLQEQATNNLVQVASSGGASSYDLYWDDPELVADLGSATSATINQLREAFQVQRMLEKDARAGTRYTEVIKSHFGVNSPDMRLQRPEFLGGGSTRININPVAQSAIGVGNQASLTAFGIATSVGQGFTKSFTEHCVIIGLANVRADITYQQGLDRMFSRQTRYDYYWPSLAHLGEQAVLNQEIYADGSANDTDVWGYQERYAEYRYKPSRVTGVMRSDHSSPLDAWHLGLDFGALPTLNDVFIQDEPPFARIEATPAEADILADFYFDYKCARPMPTFSVPGLIDHF